MYMDLRANSTDVVPSQGDRNIKMPPAHGRDMHPGGDEVHTEDGIDAFSATHTDKDATFVYAASRSHRC